MILSLFMRLVCIWLSDSDKIKVLKFGYEIGES